MHKNFPSLFIIKNLKIRALSYEYICLTFNELNREIVKLNSEQKVEK